MTYTKEFLVDALMWRIAPACKDAEDVLRMRTMYEDFYDKHGKDTFRTYASLDASYLKKYKAHLKG